MILLFMNTAMINVILLALSSGLGAGGGELKWIVLSYDPVSLPVLLLDSALGDRFGHRRLLPGEIIALITGATLTAVARAVIVLSVARAVVGLTAPVLISVSLTFIPRLFPPGRRVVATTTWMAAGAVGTPFGLLVGGPTINRWGRRAVFWLDIVVVVLALDLCLIFIPGGQARDGERPLSLTQIVTSVPGFSLLTWGLIGVKRIWVTSTT